MLNNENKICIYHLIYAYIHGNDNVKDLVSDNIKTIIEDITSDMDCYLWYEDVDYAIDILIQKWQHLEFVKDPNVDIIDTVQYCWDKIWCELVEINEHKKKIMSYLLASY